MAQNIQWCYKMQEREHSEEILDQRRTEKQLDKLQTLHLHVCCWSALLLLCLVLLTMAHNFFFLHCFYSLLAASINRYTMALLSLTSWGLQHISDFNFTASHIGLSRDLFRDTCLASASFLALRGKFHNLFLLSLTPKPKLPDKAVKFCFLLELKHSSLIQLHLHQLSVFYCLRLTVLKLYL